MRVPLTVELDHLLLGLSPGPWILDTGSPYSISDQPAFVMGRNRPTKPAYGHANLDCIRRQTGIKAIGLLGNDHLGEFDTLLDLAGSTAYLSQEQAPLADHEMLALQPIGVTSLHNVNVQIEGLGIRTMLFDTGAKFSYLNTLSGTVSKQLGRAKDFQIGEFGLEQLEVELSEILVKLGSIEGAIRCATHPHVTARLRATGAVGILGWDILKHGQVLFSPRRRLLGTCPNRAK